eukprot:7384512-Prymnesium_polylepis.1
MTAWIPSTPPAILYAMILPTAHWADDNVQRSRPTTNRRKATGSQRLPRPLQQPHRRRVSQQERLACSHSRPDLAEAVLGTACRAPLPLGIRARGAPARARDLAKRKPRVALQDSRRRCLLLLGGLQLLRRSRNRLLRRLPLPQLRLVADSLHGH